jgi:hypothetical protein
MRLTIRASMKSILRLTAMMTILLARDAGAQFLQYTPPGGPEEKPESRQAQLEREIRNARYHLGPVRIAPWAALHDLAYVRSILSAGQTLPNDFTATAGAGFRAYLHNGPRAIWTAQVLPEYVWWQRESERRRLDGRYLLGYSGFFNHVTLEVRAGREQQQQLVHPEVTVPVSSRRDGGEARAEVRIAGAFSAFAAASFNRQNHLVEDLGVSSAQALRLLDADERITRAGVRWHPDPQWSVALGAEHTQVDFLHGTLDRSNVGTAPMTEIRFQGLHVGFQADAAARSLEASRGAEFVPYHKVTGNAALLLGSEGHLGATIYTSRNLVYSLSPAYAYLDDQRLGTALTLRLGRRTRGRLFFEEGKNDYTAFSAGTPRRREDVSSYGGSLTFGLRGGLTLGLQGVRSQFNSNLAGGDHSYTSVGATINLVGFQ